MICPSCLSTRLRLSHFRPSDLRSIAILRFPVRCRTCQHRMHAGPLFALHLWQERRRKQHVVDSEKKTAKAA
jgi:hypothetical protein